MLVHRLVAGFGVILLLSALRPAGAALVDARVLFVGGEWHEAGSITPAPPPWVPDGAALDWARPERACPAPSAPGRLSLNTASRTELEALPGIGPALAERIVGGRPYRRVDDLDRIRGIGPATLGRLRPLVRP